MKVYIAIIFFAANFLMQCTAKKSDHKEEIKEDKEATTMQAMPSKEMFKGVVFANTKDYSCGMPLSAGVADTAHYKGKIYGFCSAECKADFLSKPEEYLSKK
jgi:YHS domain-containing protein